VKGGAAPRRARRQPPAFSAAWLAGRLRVLIGRLRGAQLCVAYSGGADSTALLAALAALRTRSGFAVRALHVNHQLHAGAAAMATAARHKARELGVACEQLRSPVRAARGESLEAAARRTRYAALQARLRPGEWLLLAQHREDQFETVLLQLLRGAGVAGLAAMPEVAGQLVRPLLEVTRAALREYLQRRGLRWHDDPSNQDERFDRNYLRLRVTPLIEARWPAACVTIARSARLAAEAQQLLAGLADQALRDARDGEALQVAVLRRLKPEACRNALRRWLALQSLPLPDQRRLQELAGPLLRARYDAQPQVAWPGALVRRHRDRLYAQPAAIKAAAAAPAGMGASASAGAGEGEGAGVPALMWDWRVKPQLLLPTGGALSLRADASGPLSMRALPALFEIRFRAGGERLAARHGQQTLKRLLQEHHLPTWLRGTVPLLYRDARLVAVADWWCEPELRHGANAAASAIGERGRLKWTPPGA
jgi:tRNA(Ile)-lysidine synthase